MELTTTQIKKYLYKQKPIANFLYAMKGNLYYSTDVVDDENLVKMVMFEIPFSDIGDACFSKNMESQLLIRWIYG